jgi:peptide/nickel transport system permease protein
VSWARRFLARRDVIVGLVLTLVLVGIAVVSPGDPLALDVDHGLSELGLPLPPSAAAPLGTDHLGRDVLARVAAGAATSLGVAALATLLALLIGIIVGLTAGYAGGWVDGALMRTVDLVLAFPFLLLAILLASLLREGDFGASSAPIVLTLALAGWTTIARVIRTKVMPIARGDLVLAARALGASPLRIVVRHVLPNVAGAVVVVGVLAFAQNLLAESMLSYLGLGPPPPDPTWGRMLYEGRTFYRSAPHLVLVPGLAIMVAVIAFNLLGEGLRSIVDPEEDR